MFENSERNAADPYPIIIHIGGNLTVSWFKGLNFVAAMLKSLYGVETNNAGGIRDRIVVAEQEGYQRGRAEKVP